MGMLGCCMAMNLAIEKARTHALAWAGVRNSNHFGAAGYYANMAVRHDMLGIAMSNADPNMVVPGARGRIIGNNPLAYAVPAGEEYPDSAGYRAQRRCRRQDHRYERTRTADPIHMAHRQRMGCLSTEVGDWPATGSMVPMAGHKGYGIALLIETMAGLLPGAGVLDEAKSWILNPTAEGSLGQAFIVINPGIILRIEEFQSSR